MTAEIANNLLELIGRQPNTVNTEVYYHWRLIEQDPDGNKFVDCAIAAQATLIVTNDGHFDILDHINFPSVQHAPLHTFLAMLLANR